MTDGATDVLTKNTKVSLGLVCGIGISVVGFAIHLIVTLSGLVHTVENIAQDISELKQDLKVNVVDTRANTLHISEIRATIQALMVRIEKLENK